MRICIQHDYPNNKCTILSNLTMAKFFLITYDLKKPSQNYNELYEAIKSCGEWQHPLESTWVVKVGTLTLVNDIYNHLRPKIDDGDLLFIVDITDQNRQGWMVKSFWEWIKS